MLLQREPSLILFRDFEAALTARDTSASGAFQVATLGPTGTSSEAAARHLLRQVDEEFDCTGEIVLHPSFEMAAATVVARQAVAVVVPSAYSDVNQMYMNPRLRLAC